MNNSTFSYLQHFVQLLALNRVLKDVCLCRVYVVTSTQSRSGLNLCPLSGLSHFCHHPRRVTYLPSVLENPHSSICTGSLISLGAYNFYPRVTLLPGVSFPSGFSCHGAILNFPELLTSLLLSWERVSGAPWLLRT